MLCAFARDKQTCVWRFIEPIGKIDTLNLSPQPINIAKGRQR
jgi:hypothetical protein